MIRIELANTTPMDLSVLAVASQNIDTLTAPLTDRSKDDCCSCSSSCGCVHTEYAFAGASDYESDRTQRFVQKQLATDIVLIELWKNDIKVADITDDTYGTYYNNVGVNLNITGCEIEWASVYAALGGGIYKIKFDVVIAGISFIRETHNFRVMPFDVCAAQDTIRIEVIINENIQGLFNYAGMNQRLWTRVNGTLDTKQPKIEDNEYLTGSRDLKDFQTKTPTTYQMQIKDLPSPVFNMVVYEQLIAGEIYVSDYSLPYFESLVSLPLKRSDYGDVIYTNRNTKASIDITMKPRKDLPLGRMI